MKTLKRANGPPAADIRYLDPQSFKESWRQLAYDSFTLLVYTVVVSALYMGLLIAYMRLAPV